MIEKVNPSHPDKIADRIAGAIVDLAYQVQDDPKVAVEVLIGHGVCHAIVETSAPMLRPEVLRAIHNAIHRIAGFVQIDLCIVPQDAHLADNQQAGFRCGDNGIFKGMPLTDEQKTLTSSGCTPPQKSTRSAIGPAAQMWTPAPPTASSVPTWPIP